MGQMSRQKSNSAEAPKSGRDKQTLFVGQFRKTKLCRFHETGRCRYAEKCPFAHSPEELEELPDLRKTSMCKNWQVGCCALSAEACAFAHGKEELRKTPSFGRKKSQDFDRKDSFEGSDSYASTSEGHGFDDRQSSSSCDEEPFTPRQLAWDPLGMAEQGLERLQRRGTLTADAMQRMTSIETVMAQNVQPTVGMMHGCPVVPAMGTAMGPAMGQLVFMPAMQPVMWNNSQYAPSNKELEEMLKQAMPTHYDD